MQIQEILPIVLTVMLSILTIMTVMVGVLVIQVLFKVKKTLENINDTVDMAEAKISAITSPLQSIGGMAASLGTGLRVFESFIGWMNRNKE